MWRWQRPFDEPQLFRGNDHRCLIDRSRHIRPVETDGQPPLQFGNEPPDFDIPLDMAVILRDALIERMHINLAGLARPPAPQLILELFLRAREVVVQADVLNARIVQYPHLMMGIYLAAVVDED